MRRSSCTLAASRCAALSSKHHLPWALPHLQRPMLRPLSRLEHPASRLLAWMQRGREALPLSRQGAVQAQLLPSLWIPR
jgi:hypothetical protein